MQLRADDKKDLSKQWKQLLQQLNSIAVTYRGQESLKKEDSFNFKFDEVKINDNAKVNALRTFANYFQNTQGSLLYKSFYDNETIDISAIDDNKMLSLLLNTLKQTNDLLLDIARESAKRQQSGEVATLFQKSDNQKHAEKAMDSISNFIETLSQSRQNEFPLLPLQNLLSGIKRLAANYPQLEEEIKQGKEPQVAKDDFKTQQIVTLIKFLNTNEKIFLNLDNKKFDAKGNLDGNEKAVLAQLADILDDIKKESNVKHSRQFKVPLLGKFFSPGKSDVAELAENCIKQIELLNSNKPQFEIDRQ